MIKSKYFKALMLGMCVSALSYGVAFAETTDSQDAEMTIQIESTAAVTTAPADDAAEADTTASTDAGVDKVVKRQEEVNKILFEDKASEIEAKGISIYYTTPIDNFVEVGIAPYNEDNANYIKSLIGEDMVQVIEGEEPELMATSGLAEDTDAAVVDDSRAAEAGVVSVTGTGAEETDTAQNNLLPVIGIAGVTIILGGVVIVNQKKKAAK